MDKKMAEEEVMKKAKDAQAAAGKSNGMSGRDLVSILLRLFVFASGTDFAVSSPTIRNGSRTKRKKRTSGTLRNTGSRRKTKIWRRRRNGSVS